MRANEKSWLGSIWGMLAGAEDDRPARKSSRPEKRPTSRSSRSRRHEVETERSADRYGGVASGNTNSTTGSLDVRALVAHERNNNRLRQALPELLSQARHYAHDGDGTLRRFKERGAHFDRAAQRDPCSGDAEALGSRLEGDLLEFIAKKRNPSLAVSERVAPPEDPAAVAALIEALPEAIRPHLRFAAEQWPTCVRGMTALIRKRPEVLHEIDSKLGVTFAEAIANFVRSSRDDEGAGLGRFLQRVTGNTSGWEMPGYSHVGMLCSSVVESRPALILDMIRHAREGRNYPLDHMYRGDGPDELPPLNDMVHGFDDVSGWSGGLRVDRALAVAVVEVLKPERYPPGETIEGRCNPAAVAISRIIGEKIRYGYAFNIRNGADLVRALAGQGTRGLVMADVEVRVPEFGWHKLHFPRFSNYDAKEGKLDLSIWMGRKYRVSIDNMKFTERGDYRPAVFYHPHETIDRFITG